jgi:nucleotide-binding universal stress UspA family protein
MFVPNVAKSVISSMSLATFRSAEAQAILIRVCSEKRLRDMNNRKLKRSLISVDPATEILKTIDSEGIDLVITGTHGRKGLDHTIFGSVAENVVKKSPALVLVINPYKIR